LSKDGKDCEVAITVTAGVVTAGDAVCANAAGGGGGGGTYSIGDTGPGGGTIFYVATTPFACGATLASTCTYLEAAPADLSGGFTWCSDTTTSLGVTATAIGTGMANTTTADATCTSGAIQAAADYTNNGQSDWFLPSDDEMTEMYDQRTVIGGFSTNLALSTTYWSSSEIAGFGQFANTQDTYFGFKNTYFKDQGNGVATIYVRPARAF
jgi:hypothetical protein